MVDTAEKAKADMIGLMKFYKETALEDNRSYPDFLIEDFEVQILS